MTSVDNWEASPASLQPTKQIHQKCYTLILLSHTRTTTPLALFIYLVDSCNMFEYIKENTVFTTPLHHNRVYSQPHTCSPHSCTHFSRCKSSRRFSLISGILSAAFVLSSSLEGPDVDADGDSCLRRRPSVLRSCSA